MPYIAGMKCVYVHFTSFTCVCCTFIFAVILGADEKRMLYDPGENALPYWHPMIVLDKCVLERVSV